jgi:hypothetical protein
MTDEAPPSPVHRWRKAIAEGSGLSATQRHVALTLSLYVDLEDLSTYVGPTRLAEATGLSLRTIKRTLPEIVDAGWLMRKSRGGSPAGGRREASVHCLTFSTTGVTESPVSQSHRCHGVPRPVTQDSATGDRGSPHQERSRDIQPLGSSKLSTAGGAYAIRCLEGDDVTHPSEVADHVAAVRSGMGAR